MLKEKGFANAFAFTSGVAYLVFYLLSVLLPTWFDYLFNAQFFGAEAAILFSNGFSFNLGVLVTLVVTGWIFGYLIAWAYNKFK